MHPALTYALLAVCAAAFVLGFLVDGRRKESRLARFRRYALVLQLGAIAGAYLVLRPGHGVESDQAIRASLAHGRPVLLDYFSNY